MAPDILLCADTDKKVLEYGLKFIMEVERTFPEGPKFYGPTYTIEQQWGDGGFIRVLCMRYRLIEPLREMLSYSPISFIEKPFDDHLADLWAKIPEDAARLKEMWPRYVATAGGK